ncbi:MAG: hypothetical protein ACK53Y_27320, partial [bacterium]
FPHYLLLKSDTQLGKTKKIHIRHRIPLRLVLSDQRSSRKEKSFAKTKLNPHTKTNATTIGTIVPKWAHSPQTTEAPRKNKGMNASSEY